MKNYRFIGILAAIGSGVLFGISPTLVSIVNSNGVSSLTVCFLRFSISFLLFLIYIFLKKMQIPFYTKILKHSFLASLCSSLATICLYSSYRYIGISAGTTLHFSYPVLVVLFTTLFFKEKPSRKTAFCTAVCFLGVLFFFEKRTDSITGIAFALLSGVFYCFYMISIEKLELSKMNPIIFGLFISLFNTLIIGLFDSVLAHQISLQMSALSFVCCIIVALMTSVLATLCLQIAVRYTSSVLVSLLSLFEPISSVLCGFALLHEPFSLKKGIGCLIIMISLIILIKPEKGNKKWHF